MDLLVPHFEERIPQDGSTTCAWHRGWEYQMRWYHPYTRRCDICGGPTGDHRAARHELCRLRASKGLPTPRLDATPECPCSRCRSAKATKEVE